MTPLTDVLGSGWPVTSDGECQRPVSATAAASASDTGLTLTSPCPMTSAARLVSPDDWPTLPEKPLTGSCHGAPMPNSPATSVRFAAVSRWDRPANAVEQASAKSLLNGGVCPIPVSIGILAKFCPFTG